MNKLKESMNYLFNWKKNPASVFFFAIPLAIIGFPCMVCTHISCGESMDSGDIP
jgi:hypothetical protein